MPNPSLAEVFDLIRKTIANKHGLDSVFFQFADEEAKLASSPRIHLIPTRDIYEPGEVTQLAQPDTLPGDDGANIEVKTRAPWQCLEGGDLHFYVPKTEDHVKDNIGLRKLISGMILCLHHILRARANYRIGEGRVDGPAGMSIATIHYVLPIKVRVSIYTFQPTARAETITVTLG